MYNGKIRQYYEKKQQAELKNERKYDELQASNYMSARINA